MSGHNNQSIILFDGICTLCNGFVDFVVKRDLSDKFLFASLQSKEGQQLLMKYELKQSQFDTIVLIEDEKIFTKSGSIIRIFNSLTFPLSLFRFVLLLIPSKIRDWIYQWISTNRYKLFGVRNSCRIPSDKERLKFIGVSGK